MAMERVPCSECGRDVVWEYMGSGIKFCTTCGTMNKGTFEEYDKWSPNEQITRSCYTRSKRFQKYLAHACRMQSSSSVPNDTWEYLIRVGPFSNPAQIKEKQARSQMLRQLAPDVCTVVPQHQCSDPQSVRI